MRSSENYDAGRRWRSVSGIARTSLTLGLGILLGAGGLALGDISTSSTGVKSGTLLTCAGRYGSLSYSPDGRCRRSKRRVVLADSAPLVATLTSGGQTVSESPGIFLVGTGTPGEFEAHVTASWVRDVRKCSYTATPSVSASAGQITRQVDVVGSPLDSHHVLFQEFDSAGQASSDGISVQIYCP